MPEAARALGTAAIVVTGTVAWLSWRALRLAPDDPNRLVAELRLAQIGALVLAFVGAAYAGVAVAQPHVQGTALDVALAVGFTGLSATAMLREPRQALTLVALGALAHAVVDVLHRPGLLPDVVPRWFTVGCAVQNLVMAAAFFLPVGQRERR